MRKVIGIGETVLDIIFKDNRPVEAVPGGSTFNSIVSLSRAGVRTVFVSETGNDRVGGLIRDFLRQNGVDDSYMHATQDARSPISLAFLDSENNADYVFYREKGKDRYDFSLPEIEADDIVVFGSYYAVNPDTRPQVRQLLETARRKGAIVYYDVNFRPSHRRDVMRVTPNLIENLEFADIVRGSRDDFSVIYNKEDADRVYSSEISFYCKRMVFTDGPQPVRIFADGGLRLQYEVAATDTVSTIGAGDNFNAGLVYGLLRCGVTRAELYAGLSADKWHEMTSHALAFSAECCKDISNYISPEFGQKMRMEQGF